MPLDTGEDPARNNNSLQEHGWTRHSRCRIAGSRQSGLGIEQYLDTVGRAIADPPPDRAERAEFSAFARERRLTSAGSTALSCLVPAARVSG